MKKYLNILLKLGVGLILIAMMLITITSFSPIYDFQQPKPFSGKDIFNPYRNFEVKSGWKRSVFHVHTRVRGLMNECEMWPDQVHESLSKFDYDIITFSNHNELTTHPFDTTIIRKTKCS